jgi:hypothetical protein
MVRNEEDSAWKEVLDCYLKHFLELCLPTLSQLIDWNKKWKGLEQELQTITQGSVSGKQLVDKLYGVYLKDGSEQWILIHLEIQGKKEKLFPQRMFTYAYRSFDKYKKPIISIAILTDKNTKWRPRSFKIGLVGSYLKSQFLTIKIIDYQDKKTELDESKNPFASVLLSQLVALELKKKNPNYRKQIKLDLIKRLYKMGLKKKDIYTIGRFIDYIIGLPKDLELECTKEVYQFEKEKKMAYISSFERFGIEKGIKQGIQKGMQQGIEQGIQKGMQQGIEQGIQKGMQQGIEQGIQKGMQQGIEQGIQKGIQQGIQQGIQKGIQQGRQQGLEQGAKKKAREVAIRLLNKGFSEEIIAEVTLLDKKEIKLLQEELTT